MNDWLKMQAELEMTLTGSNVISRAMMPPVERPQLSINRLGEAVEELSLAEHEARYRYSGDRVATTKGI